MKKIILCVLLSGLLGIAMTSCQKENDLFNGNYSQTTFSAYVAGSGDKTFLDGLYIKWNQHDKISIAGTDRTSVYHVKEGSIDNNGQSAIFQCQEGEDVSGAPFVATYPAGSCSATSVTLPEVQTYNADSNMLGFPMYAKSNDHTLHFQNLCSVLKLTLQRADASIKQIIITTDQQIVGQFSLSDTTEGGTTYKHVKAATSTDATHNSVTLDCGNGVSIASAKDFYIYLPVGTYNKFIITAITTTNATFTLSKKSTSGPMYFNRNHIKYLHPSNPKFSNTPTNGVGGLYSVSPDHRVYIAHGNLRAIKSTSGWGSSQRTTWNWSFFPEQHGTYHGLTVNDVNRELYHDPSYQYQYNNKRDPQAYLLQNDDTLSYFTYGYNSTNSTTYWSYTPNGTTNDSYVEYGEQPSVISGIGEHWRVLSLVEWNYLLEYRTMFFGAPRFSTVTLTLSNGRTQIYGVVLYPDRYPVNDPTNHPIVGNANAGSQYTSLSWSTWQKMEQQGCVFLPAAGTRYYNKIFYVFKGSYGSTYYEMYYRGIYLSSTNDPDYVFPEAVVGEQGGTHCGGIFMMSDRVVWGDLNLQWGHTIRMVMDEEYGDGTLYN